MQLPVRLLYKRVRWEESNKQLIKVIKMTKLKMTTLTMTGQLLTSYQDGDKCLLFVMLLNGLPEKSYVSLDIRQYEQFDKSCNARNYLITSPLGSKTLNTSEEVDEYVNGLLVQMGYQVSVN